MDKDLFRKSHKTHHNFDKPNQQKSQVNCRTELGLENVILKVAAKSGKQAR